LGLHLLIQRLCHLKVPDKEYRAKINILNIFCRIMIPIIKIMINDNY